MSKHIWLILIIVLILASGVFADAKEWRFTKDETFERGYYVPKDLPDCFLELNKALDEETIEDIRLNGGAGYHMSLGLFIRNYWIRGNTSRRLGDYFIKLGISSPDDMSGIILRSYSRFLNGKDIELDNQIKQYQHYYAEMKEPIIKTCPNDGKKLQMKFVKITGEVLDMGFKAYHIYYCKVERIYWVYENGIGWYLPTEEQKKWIEED